MTFDPDPHPCARLWRAVLNQLILDAEAHRRGVLALGGDRLEAETAYLELRHCGPHLRYVATMNDLDPLAVSVAYRRWADAPSAGPRS